MLQRLYAHMLEIAAGPHALPALLVVSFAESSVFPIPPDILLIPMILARPSQAWRLAALCTLSSVAGGLLGYAIGYFLFDAVGRPVLEFYNAMGSYDALKAGFAQWGVWIIIIKGMTPIPYKLITIASGVAHFDLLSFIFASIISRSTSLFSAGGAAVVFRRRRARIHRAAPDAGDNGLRRAARRRFCGAALSVSQGNL